MERLGTRYAVLVACALVLGLCASGQGRIIYVDDDGTGPGDGSSWAGALVHLQDALAVAGRGDEIRVAQGIYRPDRGAGVTRGDREAMFRLVSGATLAGGYAGLTGADADARDIDLYETILSGDLNGDDGPDFSNYGDNSCYGVVNSLSNHATTVLQGFTISGGWANSGAGIRCLGSDLQIDRCTVVRNKTRGTNGHGAGMYNEEGSPTLTNCTFRGNWAWGDGGGFFSESGDLALADCLFEGNTAAGRGGGLYSRNGVVLAERCEFRGNEGLRGGGGGMHAEPSEGSICIDCLFIENVADVNNWGSGGGAYLTGSGSMTFRRCLFQGNSANEGGALENRGDIALIECSFHQNMALDEGGGIINTGTLDLRRCRFTRNEAGRGGALNTRSGAAILVDCVFEGNVAARGGGAVYTDGSVARGGRGVSADIAPRLFNCRFAGNRAIRSCGGGLYNYGDVPILTSCLFVGNAADDGGGVYSRGAGPLLVGCTLADNRGGLGGGLSDETGGTVLDHCIVWGNEDGQVWGAVTAFRSDIQGGWIGEGNSDVDPLFAAPGYWDPNGTPESLSDDFWVDGDYHLQSRGGRWDPDSESWVQDAVTSPCIDAGDSGYPVRDEPLPNGGLVNLGAYGGTVEASKTDLGDPLDAVVTGVVIHVDDDAGGAGDGLSWPGALASLQDALALARPGDEVRVAQGSYTPTDDPLDREATFELKRGTRVRGGYAGVTATTPDTRDPNIFTTILSGDIDHNDFCDDPNSKNGNSYHVVTCEGPGNRAVLVGVVITGGKADKICGHCVGHTAGAGLLCKLGCSPHLVDCVFFDNHAFSGGAVSLPDSFGSREDDPTDGSQWQPVFTRCLFLDNTASRRGGGVRSGRRWHPVFTGCIWENNVAGRDGGAIECGRRSDLTLTGCVLRRNDAGQRGGAVNADTIGEITLFNCLLVANTAGETGGAIAYPDYNYGGDEPEALSLVNCTFHGNTSPTLYRPPTLAVQREGESRSYVTAALIANCIIYGTIADPTSGVPISFESGIVDPRIINSIHEPGPDPQFVDPFGADRVLGTADDDFRLAPYSPAIDAGSNEPGPPLPSVDLDGKPRIINGIVDLGVYEAFAAHPPARGRGR